MSQILINKVSFQLILLKTSWSKKEIEGDKEGKGDKSKGSTDNLKKNRKSSLLKEEIGQEEGTATRDISL